VNARLVLPLSLSLLATACEDPAGGAPLEQQAWVVAGRVTDAAGEPLPSVYVVADDQLLYDSNLVAVTDEDGVYRIELPDMATTWSMSAQHVADYHDRTYHFDLHSVVDQPFSGEEGAIRDFEWLLSGEDSHGDPYGGFVVGYARPGDSSFDVLDVELTMVPDGPLVDGSDGAVVSGGLEATGDGFALVDVPVGRYAISAVVNDQPLLVRVRNSGEAFEEAVVADFESPYGELAIHRIEVELKRP
jgi:hypothetical protein